MRPRSLVIALALLVVLGTAWLLLQSRQEHGWQDPGYTFPVLSEPVRFTLERDDERIVLEKRGEAWHIVEPMDFPAARFPVENLEGLFAEPLVIDLARDPEQADRLGLGSGAPRLEVTDAGGAVFAVRIGNPVEVERTRRTLTWLQPEDGAGIYRVGLDAGRAVRTSLSDLRERRIVHLASDAIAEMVLEQGEERSELVRVEGTWYFADRQPSGGASAREGEAAADHGESARGAAEAGAADGGDALAGGAGGAGAESEEIPESERPVASRVRSLVSALSSTRATEFADELTWEQAGLDAPIARATLRTRDGEEVTLVLGAPPLEEGEEETADTLFPLALEGAPHVYRVRQSVANQLRKDRASLLPEDEAG